MGKQPIKQNENHVVPPHRLGLYIHIPFCVKKCDYCDFLSAPATEELKSQYFEAIITEINSYQGLADNYIVPTIFFGGGTPSCVDATYISRVMDALAAVFSIDYSQLEASIEINPGTISEEKLVTYKKAGINRLSFGLQSVHNDELKLLGRIHNYEQFEENYHMARSVGFTNINVDLMSALPGQTLESWEKTLNTVINLKPEHISAYSLIIEEGTNFYLRYHNDREGANALPDEETDRHIYHRTKEILEQNDYLRYEISNYAKKGYECKHNSSYWTGTDYLGIGLGASSLLEGARFSNIQDIKKYILLCKEYESCKSIDNITENCQLNCKFTLESPLGIRMDYEVLSQKERMEEFMFLGLRLCCGVSQKAFQQRFEHSMDVIYGTVLLELEDKKLLERKGDSIYLTEYGIDVSNIVLSEFLLD